MDTITLAELDRLPPAHRECVQRAAAYIALADALGTPMDRAISRLALLMATSSARLCLLKGDPR